MQDRANRGMKRLQPSVATSLTKPNLNQKEVGKEGIQDEIAKFCNSQFPRWKFIHSRTDRRSTTPVGSPDFVVFIPGGRVLCVECKSKSGKLSIEQLAWSKEMGMIGHTIHVVRSLGEFIALTKPN